MSWSCGIKFSSGGTKALNGHIRKGFHVGTCSFPSFILSAGATKGFCVLRAWNRPLKKWLVWYEMCRAIDGKYGSPKRKRGQTSLESGVSWDWVHMVTIRVCSLGYLNVCSVNRTSLSLRYASHESFKREEVVAQLSKTSSGMMAGELPVVRKGASDITPLIRDKVRGSPAVVY